MAKKNKDIKYPRHWWFSSNKMTCYVQTDKDDVVTRQSAPVVKAFAGQHVKKLASWLKRKHGGFLFQEFGLDKKPIYR